MLLVHMVTMTTDSVSTGTGNIVFLIFTAPEVLSMGNIKQKDISHVKDFAKSVGGVKSTDPVLLVRVLCKSRILHYAKVGKIDKWPFQVKLFISFC